MFPYAKEKPDILFPHMEKRTEEGPYTSILFFLFLFGDEGFHFGMKALVVARAEKKVGELFCR